MTSGQIPASAYDGNRADRFRTRYRCGDRKDPNPKKAIYKEEHECGRTKGRRRG